MCHELASVYEFRIKAMTRIVRLSNFFFFNDTATTEIYTLSLHDALPICAEQLRQTHHLRAFPGCFLNLLSGAVKVFIGIRSEEHTSELQSRLHLVCRLLLEKKKPS